MTTHRAPHRRLPPALVAAALMAGALTACQDLFVEPAPGDPAGLALSLSPSVALLGGAGDAFDRAEVARIRLLRAGAVVVDTEVRLPPAGEERAVEVEVEIEGDSETLELHASLLWSGNALFEGSTSVRLERGQTAEAGVQLAPVVGRLEVPASAGPITAIGGTLPLEGAVLFATGDTVENAQLTWQSLDPAVATVTTQGMVTARSEGEARIVARYLEHQATVLVRVQAVVARVDVTPAALDLNVGSEFGLTATVRDPAGNVLSRAPTWHSSAPAVASVDGNGIVRAVSPGNATITATAGGVTSNGVAVTVTLVPAASITVEPTSASLQIGQSVLIRAVLRDAAGNVLTGRPVRWQSSNPQVADVEQNGSVTARAGGQTTITATAESVSATAAITVVVPVIQLSTSLVSIGTSLGTNPPAATVGIANSGTGTLSGLSVSVQYTGQAQGWLATALSGTNAPATLTLNIDASTLAEGAYTAIATVASNLPGVASRTITVELAVRRVPVVRVEVTPPSSTLLIGETVQLTATPFDAAGNVLTGRSVAWSSGSTPIATVNANGLVTAIAGGQAQITATIEGVAGSASVTVNAPIIQPSASSLLFQTNVGKNPPSQLVTIANGGTGTLSGLSVQVAYHGPQVGWLQLTLTQGANGGTLDVAAIAATLPAGTQTATVTVSSSLPGVQSETIAVTLEVIPLYTVRLTAGSGDGSVSGGGFDCTIKAGIASGTCGVMHPQGTQITLTAAPAPGYVFTGWGGACGSAGTNASCTLVVNADLDVAASFSASLPRPPFISNLQVTLVEINSASSCSHQTPNGSLYRTSFDYTDVDGNVTMPVLTEQYLFSNGQGATWNPTYSRTGDSFKGTVTYLTCTLYSGSQSITRDITLADDGGLRSNTLTTTEQRPVGGNGGSLGTNGANLQVRQGPVQGQPPVNPKGSR
jgi:uncharacterized repeat protein (TIGR02543 family)